MLKLKLTTSPRAEAPAVAARLEEAETVAAKAEARVATLQASLGAAVLAGEGDTHAADLASARAELERQQAVVAELRRRLAEAERRDRRAALERLAAEAASACQAAGQAISKEYPRLASAIVRLLVAEREAEKLREQCERELLAAGEEAAGLNVPPAPKRFYVAHDEFGLAAPLHTLVRLPRLDPAGREGEAVGGTLWPPAK